MDAKHNPLTHVLNAVGMPVESEPEGSFFKTYAELSFYSMLLAGAVSYARNRDPKWALVHGMLGAYYLAYVVIRPVVHKE